MTGVAIYDTSTARVRTWKPAGRVAPDSLFFSGAGSPDLVFRYSTPMAGSETAGQLAPTMHWPLEATTPERFGDLTAAEEYVAGPGPTPPVRTETGVDVVMDIGSGARVELTAPEGIGDIVFRPDGFAAVATYGGSAPFPMVAATWDETRTGRLAMHPIPGEALAYAVYGFRDRTRVVAALDGSPGVRTIDVLTGDTETLIQGGVGGMAFATDALPGPIVHAPVPDGRRAAVWRWTGLAGVVLGSGVLVVMWRRRRALR
ncbi:MAG: hypothetical protein U0Q21_02425 [Dermatophilaceae bacterium]